MKKILTTLALLIISSIQSMDQAKWHENPATSQFLSAVNVGDINLLSCSTKNQEELDEALYNAVYFNQIDALHTLFESGANPASIAAKHAYIKAMVTGNQMAITILKQYQVPTYSYEKSFLIAVEDQSADLVKDFMRIHKNTALLQESTIKLGLIQAIETADEYIFTLILRHINIKIKGFAVYLATKHAITSTDTSFVKIALAAKVDPHDSYCMAALMLALGNENIALRRLLFDAKISPQKPVLLRSRVKSKPVTKLQKTIKKFKLEI